MCKYMCILNNDSRPALSSPVTNLLRLGECFWPPARSLRGSEASESRARRVTTNAAIEISGHLMIHSDFVVDRRGTYASVL